jgi:hypothetical protein
MRGGGGETEQREEFFRGERGESGEEREEKEERG